MNMLDIENVIKKMTVKEFRNFIYENHLKEIGFTEKKVLFTNTIRKKKSCY